MRYFEELERSKSKRDRYIGVEHDLRFLSDNLNDDNLSLYRLDEIKQAIIIFLLKEEFQEDNEIFLENIKLGFYMSIKDIEKTHPELKNKLLKIKLFSDDFIFNRQY